MVAVTLIVCPQALEPGETEMPAAASVAGGRAAMFTRAASTPGEPRPVFVAVGAPMVVVM